MSNTGVKYISLMKAWSPKRGQRGHERPAQYIVGVGKPRAFPYTDEGLAAANAYLDAVLAGQEFEQVPREERELLEPETFEERVRVYAAHTKRHATFRKRVLAKYGPACVKCGYDTYVEAAHVVAVKDGGTDAATNGRPLCPNHHKEYDMGLWEL